MPLTDAKCRNLKPESKPKKHTDGAGLYLLVNPSGSKLWRLDCVVGGKRKTLSFGAYPEVSLAEARDRRTIAKAAIARSLNPSQAADTGAPTFEVVARQWWRDKGVAWTPAHQTRIISRLEADVFPALGERPVDAIRSTDVLAALRKVEERGVNHTTKRLRQTISSVFRYAVAGGMCERDPARDIGDALKASPKVRHQPMMQPAELQEFFGKLANYEGDIVTPLAIEFTMHTMTRTAEVRFAKWSEFDGDQWRIPVERMKMDKEHVVPITPRVRWILDTVAKMQLSSEWVFPGHRGKAMSENTMLYALYRMGFHSRATMHGMRRLASTVLNESGLWSPDAIERQLAHVPQNEVRAAYNAALYWGERVRMMAWWSDYLEERREMAELLG